MALLIADDLHDGGQRAPRLAFLVGSGVFVVMFGVLAQPMLSDPDTSWHVFFGQWIVANGKVPTHDAWSFTMAGQPWIAKEWLSQVLYGAAYSLAGWNGVCGLAAGAIGLAFGLLAWCTARRLGWPFAAFCVGAAFVLALQHMLARPHVLSYPIIVVWFAVLSAAVDSHRAPSPWWAVLMLLWANLHGGFTIGLVFAAAFAVTSIWEAPADTRRRLILDWARFLGLTLLAACVTPYGPQSMLITVKLLRFGDEITRIAEWRPTDFRAERDALLVALGWIGLLLAFAPRFSVPRIGMVLALVSLFVTAARNAELLGFALPFVIASRRSLTWRAFKPETLAPVGAYVALAAVVIMLSSDRRRDLSPHPTFTPSQCLAAARLKNLLGKPVLNSYEFGGPMIARGIPTFVDGRSELFGPDFLASYNAFQFMSGNDPLAIAYGHDVAWTLLLPQTPVINLLDRLPDWQRAFTADNCVLHIRLGSPS